jgi:hypothetical protein
VVCPFVLLLLAIVLSVLLRYTVIGKQKTTTLQPQQIGKQKTTTILQPQKIGKQKTTTLQPQRQANKNQQHYNHQR